jgi:hypothetical protein
VHSARTRSSNPYVHMLSPSPGDPPPPTAIAPRGRSGACGCNPGKACTRLAELCRHLWDRNPVSQKLRQFTEMRSPLNSPWDLRFQSQDMEDRYILYLLRHGLRAQDVQSLVWIVFFLVAIVSDPPDIRFWAVPFRFACVAAGILCVCLWRMHAARLFSSSSVSDPASASVSDTHDTKTRSRRRFAMITCAFIMLALLSCQAVRMGVLLDQLPRLGSDGAYLSSTAGPLIAFVACSTCLLPWRTLVVCVALSAVLAAISEAIWIRPWTSVMTIQAVAWALVVAECAILAYTRELDERRLCVLEEHASGSTDDRSTRADIRVQSPTNTETVGVSIATKPAYVAPGARTSSMMLLRSAIGHAAVDPAAFPAWYDGEHESTVVLALLALLSTTALFVVQDRSLETVAKAGLAAPSEYRAADGTVVFQGIVWVRLAVMVTVAAGVAALAIGLATVDSWAWWCRCLRSRPWCTRMSLRIARPWMMHRWLAVCAVTLLGGALYMWWSTTSLRPASVSDAYMNAFCRLLFVLVTAVRMHHVYAVALCIPSLVGCAVLFYFVPAVLSQVLVFVVPYALTGLVLSHIMRQRQWRTFHLACTLS